MSPHRSQRMVLTKCPGTPTLHAAASWATGPKPWGAGYWVGKRSSLSLSSFPDASSARAAFLQLTWGLLQRKGLVDSSCSCSSRRLCSIFPKLNSERETSEGDSLPSCISFPNPLGALEQKLRRKKTRFSTFREFKLCRPLHSSGGHHSQLLGLDPKILQPLHVPQTDSAHVWLEPARSGSSFK